MSNDVQIRILKESVIAEMKWMYQPDRMDYFRQAIKSIQDDSDFSVFVDVKNQNEYDCFISNLKKFNNPTLPYYHETAELLKPLLKSEEVRIWTKKEVMELHEVFTESFNQMAQECFIPIFEKVNQAEILLIYR